MTVDRKREMRFAAIALLVPLVLVLIGEAVSRQALAYLDRNRFDWDGLIAATAVDPTAAESTFRPNSQWQHIAFNEFGVRGPDLPTPKPDGVTRIAIVGDSVVFGAKLTDDEMLATRLVEILSQRNPKCQFDTLTFAGPSYTTAFLERHWPPLSERLQPDITIIFAGSPYEAFARVAPPGEANEAMGSALALFERSGLIELTERVLRRFSLAQHLSPPDGVDPALLDRLESAWDGMAADLAPLSGSPQTLLIGHRFRVRPIDDPERADRMTQSVRRATGLESPDAAIALVEGTVARMASTARAQGWAFLDAQTAIPPDGVHYRDPLHLSAAGVAALAEVIAPDVEPMLAPCNGKVELAG